MHSEAAISLQGVVTYNYVACRSVCDRDQNWIKWIKVVFESQSSDQGDLWTAKIKESRMCGSILTFDPTKERLKGRLSNQAHFLPIKNLHPGWKRFNRQHISDYPLNDSHQMRVSLVVVFHDLFASSSAGVWHPLSPQTQWDCWKIPDNGMSTINGGHCYIQPLAWPLLYCIVPVVAILFAEGLVLLYKQLPMMDKMLVRQVFITVALCTTRNTVRYLVYHSQHS